MVDFVGCARVEDLPKPYLPCKKEKCTACGYDVWISEELVQSLIDEKRDFKILCSQCVFLKMSLDPENAKIETHPVTVKEMSKILSRTTRET